MSNAHLTLFEGQKMRRIRDEIREQRLFSVVDVVSILSASTDGRKYWKVLKGRLIKEGSEVVTNCYQLKLVAQDGKMRVLLSGLDEVSRYQIIKDDINSWIDKNKIALT